MHLRTASMAEGAAEEAQKESMDRITIDRTKGA
jgi:hypothetical protein